MSEIFFKNIFVFHEKKYVRNFIYDFKGFFFHATVGARIYTIYRNAFGLVYKLFILDLQAVHFTSQTYEVGHDVIGAFILHLSRNLFVDQWHIKLVGASIVRSVKFIEMTSHNIIDILITHLINQTIC